jgi:hypothetical protein
VPAAETSVMKGKGNPGRHRRPSDKRSQPGARVRARLNQRAGSGRARLGHERPAGKGRGGRVVVDLPRDLCRSDVEFGRKIGRGSTAEAVAAARNSAVVPMLMIE